MVKELFAVVILEESETIHEAGSGMVNKDRAYDCEPGYIVPFLLSWLT